MMKALHLKRQCFFSVEAEQGCCGLSLTSHSKLQVINSISKILEKKEISGLVITESEHSSF